MGSPAHPEVADARRARPLAEHVDKALQVTHVSFRNHLHGAIVPVAYVASQPEAAGMGLGKKPEPDPLDVAEDLRGDPAPRLLIGHR